MSIKTVTYTVPGLVECTACSCRDAYICLSSSATVTLVSAGDVFPAEITSSTMVLKKIGAVDEKDACCNTVSQSVYYPYTTLTLKYDSEVFVDPTDEISELDIACVTVDGCAVKASAL